MKNKSTHKCSDLPSLTVKSENRHLEIVLIAAIIKQFPWHLRSENAAQIGYSAFEKDDILSVERMVQSLRPDHKADVKWCRTKHDQFHPVSIK